MYGHDCVLVTGACGAIGAVMFNELKRKYPSTRFVALDALTYCGKKEYIEETPHYAFYYGNITDANLVSYIFETEKPSLVIHLAAETHVDQSFGNSLKFTVSNVLGTHALLECAKKYGNLKLFIHFSTDEVYGSVCDATTCSEDAMFSPTNPYSASKAAAEMICHAYEKSFQVPIIITRCNNAISRFQHEEKLIPRCIDTLLRVKRGENVKIPVHGLGFAKRTFIDSRDIASAIDTIVGAHSRGETRHKVYNIGTGSSLELSVMNVIRGIVRMILGSEAEAGDYVEYVPDRAFQDFRYSIDSSCLRALGWCETYSFEDAVQDVINFREKL